jgi:hypothetical protein
LLIAEAAEIQRGTQFIEWDERECQRAEAGEILQGSCEVGLMRKIANPEVLQRCLDLLNEVRLRIEQNDLDTESDEHILRILYVGSEHDDGEISLVDSYPPDHWQKSPLDSYRRLSEINEGESSITSTHECRNEFLGQIAEEITRLERYKQERVST